MSQRDYGHPILDASLDLMDVAKPGTAEEPPQLQTHGCSCCLARRDWCRLAEVSTSDHLGCQRTIVASGGVSRIRTNGDSASAAPEVEDRQHH